MKLVIEIDEDTYKQAKLICGFFGHVDGYKAINAIVNGRILPKGHGRLIDADAIKLDRMASGKLAISQEQIIYAPTIIEADKEQE